MKKPRFFVTDFMSYLGAALFIIVTAVYFLFYEKVNNFYFHTLPLIVSLFGIVVIVLSMKNSKKIHQIFIGFQMFFWGLLFFFIGIQLFPYTFYQYWPLIGAASGIFLCVAGLVKYKRVLFGYFIAALTLFLLGCWFALFSFRIIKIPFQTVAIVGGPLFLIMAGIFIIGFFLLQKKHANLMVKEDENEGIEADDVSADILSDSDA
ncbi:MAG: hypothetical protein J5726_10125 [Treponema sp.]|nr:hypothetical protein [Treponema sp.]